MTSPPTLPQASAAQPLPPTFELTRNPFGKLTFVGTSGDRYEGVLPVRAFPVQSPEDGIALVCTQGHERAWIDQLAAVPEPAQTLIREELATRELMPVIQDILSVSSFSTPCTWSVQTDRGSTEFVLRGDEDIRRIGAQHALLVADAHGIQFLIPDASALSAASRKILDRFL